jgi:hypothetical protein
VLQTYFFWSFLGHIQQQGILFLSQPQYVLSSA